MGSPSKMSPYTFLLNKMCPKWGMKKLWFHDRVSNKCFKTWMYFFKKKCIIIYYVTNSNDEEQETRKEWTSGNILEKNTADADWKFPLAAAGDAYWVERIFSKWPYVSVFFSVELYFLAGADWRVICGVDDTWACAEYAPLHKNFLLPADYFTNLLPFFSTFTITQSFTLLTYCYLNTASSCVFL